MSYVLARWKGEWFAVSSEAASREMCTLRADASSIVAWPHVYHLDQGPYDYLHVPTNEVELFKRLCYRGVRVGFSFVDHKSQRVCAWVEVDVGVPGVARNDWVAGITADSTTPEMRRCLVADGWRVVDRGSLTRSIPIDELQLYNE